MMPDLGDFAVEVLAAYGVSLVLLTGIIALSLRRSRKIRKQLTDVEAKRDAKNV